jgi:hypothetical protein
MMELIKKKEGKRKKRNNKKNRFRNHRKFSLLIKVLELFLRCSILVLVLSRSSNVVSPGNWLVSSIWTFCPQD